MKGSTTQKRRNPDFFAAGGKVHPIRNSRGYDEILTNSPAAKKRRKKALAALAEQRRKRGGRFLRG